MSAEAIELSTGVPTAAISGASIEAVAASSLSASPFVEGLSAVFVWLFAAGFAVTVGWAVVSGAAVCARMFANELSAGFPFELSTQEDKLETLPGVLVEGNAGAVVFTNWIDLLSC